MNVAFINNKNHIVTLILSLYIMNTFQLFNQIIWYIIVAYRTISVF